MSEQTAFAAFDQDERMRIQRALRRYMEEHRIGTPTLQKRIISADKPRHREIPQSTLQRFVGGSHHTNDHHVALCHAFVKDLPYYGENYDLTTLGNGLLRFLADEPRAEAMRSELTGNYELREQFGWRASPSSLFEKSVGRFSLTPVEDKPFLQVEGIVPLPPPSEEAGSHRRIVYEGVTVPASGNIYMVLRDRMTRSASFYCFTPLPPAGQGRDVKIFEGQGVAPVFLWDAKIDFGGETPQRLLQLISVSGGGMSDAQIN